MSASGQSRGWLNSGDGDGVGCIADGDGVGCIADGDGVGCIADKLRHCRCIIRQLIYRDTSLTKDVGPIRHSNGYCGDGDSAGVGVSVGIGVSVLVGSGNETLRDMTW